MAEIIRCRADPATIFVSPPTLSEDLTQEALAPVLHGRPLRCYSAVVSTGSAAHGWAVGGAPAGAVVVAERQISPRGHAGRPLDEPSASGLGFSVVLRPSLPPAREGWLYTAALTALSDVLGGAALAWPDEVRRSGTVAANVSVGTRVEGEELAWAVLDVLLAQAARPRGDVLAAVLEALDETLAASSAEVRGRYEGACETIGLRVRARLRAGTGPSVEGEAVGTLDDGALVLRTGTGGTVPVRPQDVRSLESV